jgi:hypothetical protein
MGGADLFALNRKSPHFLSIMAVRPEHSDFSGEETGSRAVIRNPEENPRLVARRQKVKLDALRRQMAAKAIETTPGRLRTVLTELRWRRQLRRSLSSGMAATRWMIVFLFGWAIGLAVVVAVNMTF